MVKLPDCFVGADFSPELIQPGIYPASVLAGKERTPASGGAPYIALTVGVEVDEGDVRWMWENLSVYHSNGFVVNLAKQRLQEIKAACGAENAGDTDDLVGCPMRVEVGTRTRKGAAFEENFIKRFVPRNEKPATKRPF